MTAIERLREWLATGPEIPNAFALPSGSKVHDAVAYAAYLLDKHEDVQAQLDRPTIPGVEKDRLHFRLRTIEADAQELLEALPCDPTPTTASAATNDSNPPASANEDSATPAGNG